MLDLKFIRQNPDAVRAGALKKRISCDLDRILELDAENRRLGSAIDAMRAEQKAAGAAMRSVGAEERAVLLADQKTAYEM